MRQARQKLLNRIDIRQPIATVIRHVARHFQLGRVRATRLIRTGYDDLNVLLDCDDGRYIVKLFNRAKSLAAIQDHARVQLALYHAGQPVPRLLVVDGEPLYRMPGHTQNTYACVADFFAGHDFICHQPQRDDLLALVRFFAALHQLPLTITPHYDAWGTLNLPREFQRTRHNVCAETARLVAPLADAVNDISFGDAQRSVIHGDVQRKHVLKNDSGRLCVLDFGCMDYSYPIVDLGVFLALFCLESSDPDHAKTLIGDVLAAYTNEASLPAQHVALLGTLVRATWAAYLLASEMRLLQGDRSAQTREWHRFTLVNLNAFDGQL
jgi:Ser/Thr protein kinase RdoA (MazF antagonist)